ncbi:NINE protein (plasmid) [Borreliella burgdorferi]|nr:NINE protein [Borreliella burgdorferi]
MLLLLCLFFGYLELHKFYVGKIKSGFTLISSHSFFFYLTY